MPRFLCCFCSLNGTDGTTRLLRRNFLVRGSIPRAQIPLHSRNSTHTHTYIQERLRSFFHRVMLPGERGREAGETAKHVYRHVHSSSELFLPLKGVLCHNVSTRVCVCQFCCCFYFFFISIFFLEPFAFDTTKHNKIKTKKSIPRLLPVCFLAFMWTECCPRYTNTPPPPIPHPILSCVFLF